MRLSGAPPILALSAAVLIASAGCGSGNGSGTSTHSGAPAFASTPVLSALQGSAYAYKLEATDPAGGAVTFTLATAPTGATVDASGDVSWTPTPAQSRTANSFTAKATSAGGSATQSWTVTPNGTVQVTDAITSWGTGGATVQPPISWSQTYPAASLLVPQSDGQMIAIFGTGDSNGVLSFQNVPAGYFWFNVNGSAYYWTSSSSIDFGTDTSEAFTSAPALPSGATPAQFALNITGLDSTATPGLIGFETVPNSFGLEATVQDATYYDWPPASSQFVSGVTVRADVSQVHDGFVVQDVPASLGTLAGYSLGPAATLSNLSLQNGKTNTINVTLNPSAQASLPLKIDASAFVPLFGSAAPAVPTQASSPFSLEVYPYAVGVNPQTGTSLTSESIGASGASITTTFDGGMHLGLFWPAPTTASVPTMTAAPFLQGPIGCGSGLREAITCGGTSNICGSTQPMAPLLSSDTDFGTIQYGDPFPSTWQRVFQFCQQATLPLPSLTTTTTILPGVTETITWSYSLVNAQSTAAPTSAVVPLISPVASPTINGASLFTPATLSTREVTLSWSKPALGTPYGYRVLVATLPQTSASGTITILSTSRLFYTAQTSLTIPPELLTSGVTYLFDITALADAKANVETAPRRSALPTALANVVSAPIVISSSAP